MSAVTDTEKMIKFDPKKKPGISNLSGDQLADTEFADQPSWNRNLKEKAMPNSKNQPPQTLIDYLEPLRRKRNELLTREVYVNDILKKGAAKAQTHRQRNHARSKNRHGVGLIMNCQLAIYNPKNL